MLFRIVRRFIGPYLGTVALVVVLQIIQTVAALTLPDLNATILDRGVLTGDIPLVWRYGGIMLAVAAVQLVATIGAVRLGADVAMAVGRDIRTAVFSRVQRFSTAEVARFGAPSLVTRSTNDVQQIQMLCHMTFTLIVMAPIMMVGGVFMAIRQDAGLSVLLAVAVPLLMLVLGVVVFLMRPWFQEVQRRLDRINLVMREQVTGVRVIRAFVREPAERRRFDTASRELFGLSVNIGRTMALTFPVVQLIITASSVAVVWFGAGRIESGEMQVGQMVAFLTYLMQIFMSVMFAMMMFMMVPRAEVCAGRVEEVLAVTPAIAAPADPTPLPARADPGRPGGPRSPAGRGLHVRAAGLTFGYPGADEPVLQDLDFTAWWQASAPDGAPLQPSATALLVSGAAGSVILWWLLRLWAQRYGQSAGLAEALHQQALDSEARLRAVLDHTDEGILTVSTTGDILGVNQAVYRIFGYTEAELRHAHLSKLLPGAASSGAGQDLETFLQLQHMGLDGVGRRTEGRRANGQLFPLGLSVNAMDWRGQAQHLCMLRDLSTQDATERAILAAQRQLNEVGQRAGRGAGRGGCL